MQRSEFKHPSDFLQSPRSLEAPINSRYGVMTRIWNELKAITQAFRNSVWELGHNDILTGCGTRGPWKSRRRERQEHQPSGLACAL